MLSSTIFPRLLATIMASGARLRQAAIARLLCHQLLIGGTADADIANGRSYQNTLCAFEWVQHDLNRELAAILAPADELDSGTHLLGKRLSCGMGPIGNEPFGKAVWE